ncbi:MAG: hypothetical protein JJT81_07950, partial [Rubellimicrobium sp.]|nr:hypothetical protein [Rubellimicrobium sp.]
TSFVMMGSGVRVPSAAPVFSGYPEFLRVFALRLLVVMPSRAAHSMPWTLDNFGQLSIDHLQQVRAILDREEPEYRGLGVLLTCHYRLLAQCLQILPQTQVKLRFLSRSNQAFLLVLKDQGTTTLNT